jgi:hypothetical protein
MTLNTIIRPLAALPVFGCLLAATAASAQEKTAALAAPAGGQSPWTPSAALALKESFDDNVYLQSVGSHAFQHSFVTAVLPTAGLAYRPADTFNANLNYAPEINYFHSAHSEDFTLHRVLMGLDGTAGKTRWEVSENFVAIDGSNLSPSYFGPGGAPAAGGPQIRDRRDALVQRGQFRLTQTLEQWFVRPVISGYFHDFQTAQRTTAGYENFVDRSDWNAGADVGRTVGENVRLALGYRYGEQTQDKLFDHPEQYNNTYHRVLAGVEGQPWPWLTLAISVGPEFRRYASSVAEGFDRNETYPYADSTLTIMPTKADAVALSVKSFEQPGFCGRSTYVDSTYELNWRHKLGGKLTVGVGLRAYNTDFLKPTERNDWIVSPSLLAAYAFNRHFSGEVSYLFDDAFSLMPNTQGREYTRNLVALGLKYAL